MRNRKTRTYTTLSRRKQRDAFVRLRWRITRDPLARKRGFYTHHGLEEAGDLDGQWADILFLGLDGHTVWNATIETVSMVQQDRARELAFLEAERRLDPAELAAATRFEWEPVIVGGERCWRSVPSEPTTFAKLDGLSWYDFVKAEEERILKEEPPAVLPSFTRHLDYRYGIGLTLVVNEPRITSAEIVRAIDLFRAAGETDWVAPR